MRQGFMQTWQLLRDDIAFRCSYEHKRVTALTPLKLMLNPGFVTVFLFRWQVFFHGLYLYPLSGLIRWLNLLLFSNDLSSSARIAGGFVVIHAHSVYIGEGVQIGRNCLIFVGNSLGASPFSDGSAEASRPPVIGDNVILGAGAAVYGAITVGDGCKIAVNSLVDSDCPPNSVMFGVPARQVSNA